MEITLEDRIAAIEALLPMVIAHTELTAADLAEFAAAFRREIAQRTAVTLHPALQYPQSAAALERAAALLDQARDTPRWRSRRPGD